LNPERWQQISRIFKSAISLDGVARAEYVKENCGSDPDLQAEVQRLIESHGQAESNEFMAGLAVEDVAEHFSDGEETFALEKDQQFGAYLIVDHLGTGGMGEVYLAKDSRLDRVIALKILSSDISSDKRRMRRFRQEAKMASSLNHPNILTIFEFDEVDGQTYIAATNVGVRPTFKTGRGLLVEAFLLDFDGDIYDHELRLDFLARLRGEKRFDSVEALVEQMGQDVVETRRIAA